MQEATTSTYDDIDDWDNNPNKDRQSMMTEAVAIWIYLAVHSVCDFEAVNQEQNKSVPRWCDSGTGACCHYRSHDLT